MNDGGPAFPETRWDDKTGQEVQWLGMTLRDYFAAKALGPTIARYLNMTAATNEQRDKYANLIAPTCYAIADAMLKERER